MQKSQLSRQGITLIEVLIVIAIVATLSAILWMVLAPSAMLSSRTAAITVGLRQASTGLSIYRADNNDTFPGDWDEFGFSKPNARELIAMGAVPTIPAPPSYPESWLTENSMSPTELTYLYNRGPQLIIRQYTPKYPFDEHIYPIFSANFFLRKVADHGRCSDFVYPNMTERVVDCKVYVRLGGFTDGHVKWGPFMDTWEEELAYRYNRGNE